MKILVTGTAGFIGNHVALRLLERGDEVVGLDNVNDYYEVRLKEARLARVRGRQGFTEARIDLADRVAMAELFGRHRPQRVVHLAAQAGVRYSLQAPRSYTESNITGFLNVLEGCRAHPVEHLVYASSSSVYGANAKVPFSVQDRTDHPLNLYAASKRANELMAHSYSHLFDIPVTGLRFFTVYGPWGRPDMAPILFARAILEGRPIDVYNHGRMQRDFTYIDDIVEGTVRLVDRPPVGDPEWTAEESDPARSRSRYRLYNIGNHTPVELKRFIEVLEEKIGKKAVMNLLPMQAGDMVSTCADVADLSRDVGFSPATPIEVGLERLVAWCREFYGGS